MFSPASDLSKRPPMVSGAFFLDRDPAAFAVILNYLRTGTVHADTVGFQRDHLQMTSVLSGNNNIPYCISH